MREVFLRFQDNKAAESFIELLDGIQEEEGEVATDVLQGALLTMGAILSSSAHVDALLARPTLSCPHIVRKGEQKDWRKHSRLGWFICPQCKRPHKLVVRNWLKNAILGTGCYNLLPELLEKLHGGENEASGSTTVRDLSDPGSSGVVPAPEEQNSQAVEQPSGDSAPSEVSASVQPADPEV